VKLLGGDDAEKGLNVFLDGLAGGLWLHCLYYGSS
jgi:hypothetical protein